MFEGGIPETSSEPNPEVTYNTQGVYNVQLTVANSDGSDIEIADEYITVELYCLFSTMPRIMY